VLTEISFGWGWFGRAPRWAPPMSIEY